MPIPSHSPPLPFSGRWSAASVLCQLTLVALSGCGGSESADPLNSPSPSTDTSYTRCLTSAIPVGSTLSIQSKSSAKTVEDAFAYRTLGPALFNGVQTTAREVTTVPVGSSTSTVTTDYSVYNAASGSSTEFGEVIVQTSGTSTSKSTFTYQPPAVVPTLVENQPFTYVYNATLVIERTIAGVVQPAITQASGGSAQVTFLGIESVTVPAGTFQACKVKTDAGPSLSTTAWLLVDYAATVKSITTVGAAVETTVADSVMLDGRPLP